MGKYNSISFVFVLGVIACFAYWIYHPDAWLDMIELGGVSFGIAYYFGNKAQNEGEGEGRIPTWLRAVLSLAVGWLAVVGTISFGLFDHVAIQDRKWPALGIFAVVAILAWRSMAPRSQPAAMVPAIVVVGEEKPRSRAGAVVLLLILLGVLWLAYVQGNATR